MSESGNNSNLTPKPFPAPAGAKSRRTGATVGLIVLVVGALLVVMVLPRISGPKEPPADEPAGETKSVAATNAPISKDILAADVQKALDEVLQLQVRLENQGVKIWGEKRLQTSYPEALDVIAAAESALGNKKYQLALTGFKKAAELLRQLESSKDKRFQDALSEGNLALQNYKATVATQNFEIALAAQPNNEQARLGLRRAKNLPQVLAHMDAGRGYEHRGELASARDEFHRAKTLDPAFQPAADSLAAVEAAMAENAFKTAVGEVIAALNLQDVRVAARSLDKAKGLRPDDPKVAELGLKLKLLTKRLQLNELQQTGSRQEQQEDWAAAVASYKQALAIDANARFAQIGLSNASENLQLHRKIEQYLNDPKQLRASEHRKHAAEIQKLAQAKNASRPKLRQLSGRLDALLQQYGSKISVTLASDNETDVFVYKVARLGRFVSKQLQLYPGQYKVQGSRSGYRDVMLTFTVKPGERANPVNVVCTEKF